MSMREKATAIRLREVLNELELNPLEALLMCVKFLEWDVKLFKVGTEYEVGLTAGPKKFLDRVRVLEDADGQS